MSSARHPHRRGLLVAGPLRRELDGEALRSLVQRGPRAVGLDQEVGQARGRGGEGAAVERGGGGRVVRGQESFDS